MRRAAALGAAILVISMGAAARAADSGNQTGVLVGTITAGGRPTSDVVLSIEGLPAKPLNGAPAEYYTHATMGQRDLRFFPHVLPVMVGSTIDFANEDKVWHDVFSTSEAKSFNVGLYAPGKTKKITFDKPGVVRILCNVHPQMEAYIVVLDHPYFATPDERGNYRFEGLPLGSYRLKIWRPSADPKIEPFTIERAGEVARLDENF
jgi:plastocyanin